MYLIHLENHVYIMQSKNPISGVQLKPSHSSDHSAMKDEAIKTAASEFGSEKLYIAGLLN